MLAHVQRFAVASTTAKEITHDDVEMVRRFGAAFQKVVFELPLSDVTVVDGEKTVLGCRATVTPAAEVTWYVENVEIRQTGDEELDAADWSTRVGGASEQRQPRTVGFLRSRDRRARGRRRRIDGPPARIRQ